MMHSRLRPSRMMASPGLAASLAMAASLGLAAPLVGPADAAAGLEPSPPPPARSVEAAHLGDEVCVSSRMAEGAAAVCAARDGFGVDWALSVDDAADDGRAVTGSLALDVTDARDPVAELRNELGVGTSVTTSGSFRPRFGSAIGDLDLTICVDIRFLPDRCHTESVAVPQPRGRGSPAHAARLQELVFDLPLAEFGATRAGGDRGGVDVDFDWSSDGCSAGPVAPVFGQFLEAACVRHDFAYRNYGQLGYDPTDDTRRRVDEQLAADAETLGRSDIAERLAWALQRFAAPVFFGDELAEVWGVPSYLASWLRTTPSEDLR